MRKLIILGLLIVLTGCVEIGPSTRYQLDEFLENYCAEEERGFENQGIIYETKIENVGYYGVGKVVDKNEELLVFLNQDFPTDKNEIGFNQIGPIFREIKDSERNFLFENLDSDYGHGKNYYIYLIDKEVSSANYDGENIDVENIEYTLNNENRTFSVLKFEFDKNSLLNENLLQLDE